MAFSLAIKIWKTVNSVFGINTTFHQILGLDKDFQYNAIATLICFLIYRVVNIITVG